MLKYGIMWREFDRNDRLVTKTKFFKTDAARTKFAMKLEEKDNFYCIVAFTL